MYKPTPRTMCTTQLFNGEFCNRRSLQGAPFPICITHASAIYEFVKYEVNAADVHVGLELMAHTLSKPVKNSYTDDRQQVVYYLRVGDMVKIGITKDLKRRLKGYPPSTVVLATEDGSAEVESLRHEQFKMTRASGREWFHPSPDLIEHINSLRDEPLTAADLAA